MQLSWNKTDDAATKTQTNYRQLTGIVAAHRS